MANDTRSLHEKLSDKEASFVKKLRLAATEGELDYWLERGNPPNESTDVFIKFSKYLKEPVSVKWIERESEAGPHGLLGEDECFKFECTIFPFGVETKYFVKGYFFNKDDLKGVTIQSFRKVMILRMLNPKND